MADALVSALISTMMGNLNTLLIGEFANAVDMRTKLENLQSTLSTIQAVLKDAEEKQWNSEPVKVWLRKLKDAAYDVDDVLDEFATEDRLRRLPADMRKRVRSFFSFNNPLVFRFKMAHRLKSVREKLDYIANEKNDFHLKEGSGDNEVDSLDWRQTSSLVKESEIIGRDEEKNRLITMLLSDLEDLSVYAVCGMGGLGKTTLAQVVYNNERVESHFDLRMWVCVSVDFDVKRLTRAILESIDRSSCNLQELDPLQQSLQEKLSGKRFLLIMDDVWDDDNDRWDQLKNALRSGAKGSAVIVTTRNEKVALMMATTPVHRLGRLSDDNSWSLFEQRAFGTDGSEEFAELKTIGKSIVKKCGGVPLAIKALASMMRLKRKESEWLSIKESAVWDSIDEGNKILPALRLSYDNLYPHLRQCFAFCSVFPKDYVMKKDQLIELWMANGFIPLNRQIDLHDIGDAIFNELVWRSFFQEVSEDSQGEITCKMHDLLHDLAQLITVEECYLIEPNKVAVPRKVRHLAVCNTIEQIVNLRNENFFEVKSLRSLLLWDDYRWSGLHLSLILRQRHLRSLTLRHLNFKKFPVSTTNLKHLRHLDVSYSLIKTLPESITRLQNLQTLNLRDCYKLIKLPRGMKHMKNLIHLDIRGCNALTSMPARMGQLACLRKLSIFIVGNHNDHSLKELNGLNLAGQLSIKDLGNVKSYRDSRSANLMSKQDLQSLSLSWTRDAGNTNSPENFEEVLRGLQPHSNLKKLEINGYRGSKFPNWMMDSSLPNVVQISLVDNRCCEHLPPLGRLNFLKRLYLRGMDAVKTIDSSAYGDGDNPFPSLESLMLDGMQSLESWKLVDGRKIFPCLGDLIVSDCPKLVELPIIPSVKTLDIWGNNVTLLESVRYYTSLTSLHIGEFDELTVLPDGQLQSHAFLERLNISCMSNLESLSNQFVNLCALKHLNVQGCEKLKGIQLGGRQNLVSLESLGISRCGLISFPTDGFCSLPSLHRLWIRICDNFTSLSHGMQYLTALEDLLLNGCPKLNSLPESIQHLTALRRLEIIDCEGLSSLPDEIRYLRSLSYLEIFGCRNLISLPEGIRSLNTLIELEITRCSHLERRCKKERGDDWPKIAHIPKITINYRLIQSLACQ